MTIINHTLGFPRVGLRRELKKAQESYWAGNATREELLTVGRELRARHWVMKKLVMDGLEMMEPPVDYTAGSMSSLLEGVRQYDNSPAAIGYTVYYYAHDMEMAQGLKLLSIDVI